MRFPISLTSSLLSSMILVGQGPVNDVMTVNFSNDVQVGSQRLKAGEYTVRQLSTSSNPRILEFSTDQGMAIQATATAIAALDNNNRNDNSVELENQGGMQHVRRIWVKGKSYGYEFPVAASKMSPSSAVMSRSDDQLRMVATYTPAAPPHASAEVARTPAPQTSPERVQQASAAPIAEPAPASMAPLAAATPDRAADQNPAGDQSQGLGRTRTASQAQAGGQNQASGQNQGGDQTQALPETASWIPFQAAAGSLLMAAGLLVRRRR